MKRIGIFGLCMFLLGLGLGNIQYMNTSTGSGSSLSVDFCFLLRNPDLIGSRRFVTDANIMSIFPHGAVLASDSCPKLGASFKEQLDRQDFNAELSKRVHDDPYGSVPISFEGTLYRPTLIRRLFFEVITKFGSSGDQTAPITIRAYTGIGKQQGDSGGQKPR